MNIEVEEQVYNFLIKTLSEEEQKQIYCGKDILRKIEENPDAESDLKDYVWDLMTKRLRYFYIIERIKEQFQEEENESSSEEEDYKEDSEEE